MQAADDDVLAGHLGVAKTYQVIRQRFYWFKMFQDIQHYCQFCPDCARKKTPRNGVRAELIPIPVEGPLSLSRSGLFRPTSTNILRQSLCSGFY